MDLSSRDSIVKENNGMNFNTTEEIIEDFRQGKMVILMDDEDRENEGDLMMAAALARPEDVNFMARYGRGLICLTLTKQRCQQLRLPLMVSGNDDTDATNFTVSIEAAEGVTTGISAADRATTVRTAVASNAQPQDLIQPGHIFPLMAQPGGVLTRAGHTEAGCDLARLAGHEAAAMIVEVLNEDGSMARRPDLEAFAQKHGIKIGTIADLIQYRIEHEKNIERISECPLVTEFGEFRLIAFQDNINNSLHLALVKGVWNKNDPVLVRVHMQDPICDLFMTTDDICAWPLRQAIQRVAEEGQGVVVLLRQPNADDEIVRKIQDIQLQSSHQKTMAKEESTDLRQYGVGAQILADLGVQKMRVLSSPKKVHALSGFNMEIVEYVACE